PAPAAPKPFKPKGKGKREQKKAKAKTKKHRKRRREDSDDDEREPDERREYICPVCHQVCTSVAGLTNHRKVDVCLPVLRYECWFFVRAAQARKWCCRRRRGE